MFSLPEPCVMSAPQPCFDEHRPPSTQTCTTAPVPAPALSTPCQTSAAWLQMQAHQLAALMPLTIRYVTPLDALCLFGMKGLIVWTRRLQLAVTQWLKSMCLHSVRQCFWLGSACAYSLYAANAWLGNHGGFSQAITRGRKSYQHVCLQICCKFAQAARLCFLTGVQPNHTYHPCPELQQLHQLLWHGAGRLRECCQQHRPDFPQWNS